MDLNCQFCNLPHERIVAETELTVTIRDGYPVSKGHTLVIPKHHIVSIFDATPEEQAQLLEAVHVAREVLLKEYNFTGMNIGVNDGESAGQTSMHLHIHVIPRYDGDMDDPRGGVRGVIPERQKY